MPNKQLRVFVGSTYQDLKSYREAVRDTLNRLELIVKGMEYFGAKPESPLLECLSIVRSCKIYIGIFGMRYGSIPEGQQKSLTHHEYEEAQFIRIPSLIYIIDEERQPILPVYVETGPGAEKLRQLKAELRGKHIVSLFTSEEDLASKIAHDLTELLQKMGWHLYSSDEQQFTVEYIENRNKAKLNPIFESATEMIKIIQTNMSTVVSEYMDSIEVALKSAKNSNKHLEVSLLTLDPDSNFAAARAKQLGIDVYQFRNELHDALRELSNRFKNYKNVQIRIYDDFPTQICFIIDNIVYNCTVTKLKQSRNNCLFKFDSRHPALFLSFVSHFTDVWRDKITTKQYLPDGKNLDQ